jgi:hypothetical protein
LVFLKDRTISMDPSIIEKFISAEIPDKELYPVAYTAVENYMIHGSSGEANKILVCMEDNRCTNHFPKAFNPETTIDEEGFPLYKRHNDDRYVKKGKIGLDNRYVIPYNMDLLVKYQTHINVEWCNMSRSVKYLFKYIYKGLDYVVVVLKEKGLKENQIDEIKRYWEMRYIYLQSKRVGDYFSLISTIKIHLLKG